MATDEPQVADCVVPDCPHCGEELVHAQPGHSADPVRQLRLLREVLDDAEASLRLSNFNRLAKVIFVWSQRKDHLIAGEETWADQRIGTPTFGADT